MLSYKLLSVQKTKQFVNIFAREILKKKLFKNQSLIIALSGDLGAGKTTFARGFLRAAGIKSKITSPTFTIVKSYKVKSYKDYKNIYHIDCYRLHKSKELLDLGLKEILKNPQNIVLIEWPEKINRALPKNIIKIKFKHGEKEGERIIKFY